MQLPLVGARVTREPHTLTSVHRKGVWQQVVRAEDRLIDVNHAVFVLAELSRLSNGSGVKNRLSVVDL
jgi:hypothetical protein